MANPIAEMAFTIIRTLFDAEQRVKNGDPLSFPLENPPYFDGNELVQWTGLEPEDLNDAVQYLDDRSLIDRMNWLGSDPFSFGQIALNSKGRYVYHETTSGEKKASSDQSASIAPSVLQNVPLLPIGSPFGFTDLDWEFVQKKKRQSANIYVVMGFQFDSKHYTAENLKANIRSGFEKAVAAHNSQNGRSAITLEFKPLAAGYGEHLFNQISRDIIAADIAVFDTSDMNSNVMIEMGVALTWGSRVLPIKKAGCPKPPSDISGQTWADYTDDGSSFTNPNHDEEMKAMVERAIQKKSI